MNEHHARSSFRPSGHHFAVENASRYGKRSGVNVTIYQVDTNDVRSNSLVNFLRTFERTKLYDLLAATPLIAWYGFVLTN
jgi:hypothetical protein